MARYAFRERGNSVANLRYISEVVPMIVRHIDRACYLMKMKEAASAIAEENRAAIDPTYVMTSKEQDKAFIAFAQFLTKAREEIIKPEPDAKSDQIYSHSEHRIDAVNYVHLQVHQQFEDLIRCKLPLPTVEAFRTTMFADLLKFQLVCKGVRMATPDEIGRINPKLTFAAPSNPFVDAVMGRLVQAEVVEDALTGALGIKGTASGGLVLVNIVDEDDDAASIANSAEADVQGFTPSNILVWKGGSEMKLPTTIQVQFSAIVPVGTTITGDTSALTRLFRSEDMASISRCADLASAPDDSPYDMSQRDCFKRRVLGLSLN